MATTLTYLDRSLTDTMALALSGAPPVGDPHNASLSSVHFMRKMMSELSAPDVQMCSEMPHIQFCLDKGWVERFELPGGLHRRLQITEAGKRFACTVGGAMPPLRTVSAQIRELPPGERRPRITKTALKRRPGGLDDGREAA